MAELRLEPAGARAGPGRRTPVPPGAGGGGTPRGGMPPEEAQSRQAKSRKPHRREGVGSRSLGLGGDRELGRGPALRRAHASEESRIHADGGGFAGSGNRRQHCDL